MSSDPVSVLGLWEARLQSGPCTFISCPRLHIIVVKKHLHVFGVPLLPG